MPAVSRAQQRFMGAALARKRKGETAPDDPKMSMKQFKEFASTSTNGLPEKVEPKKGPKMAKKMEKKGKMSGRSPHEEPMMGAKGMMGKKGKKGGKSGKSGRSE